VLLMPLVRFLPPDDPRMRATVMAVADELTEDGLVLRYRVEQTDDGLEGEEGTFAICSFWLVSALSEIGEHHLAEELCERILGYSSPLGLYAEEIDPRTGRHLGNFPQAFTHLALINAIMHVIRWQQSQELAGLSFTREFAAKPAASSAFLIAEPDSVTAASLSPVSAPAPNERQALMDPAGVISARRALRARRPAHAPPRDGLLRASGPVGGTPAGRRRLGPG